MDFKRKEKIMIGGFILASIIFSSLFALFYVPKTAYTTGSTYGYDLDNPTRKIKLPDILHEISGLSEVDSQTFACVQDEKGIAFIYDLEKGEIVNQFKFAKSGDYEGLARAGNSLYVLRSDGKLFEIENFKSKDFKVKEYDTDIPVNDSEGLGYDAINNRLLIAGKSEPKGKEYKGKRAVFAFDLNTKTTIEKPAYVFSEENIKQFVKENNPEFSKGKKKIKLKINPSGIAVHPKTGKLYVLSSRDNLMYIFNQESKVESVIYLKKSMFEQAEGITFLANGDMLISNEGGNGTPTLLFFSYEN